MKIVTENAAHRGGPNLPGRVVTNEDSTTIILTDNIVLIICDIAKNPPPFLYKEVDTTPSRTTPNAYEMILQLKDSTVSYLDLQTGCQV